MKDDAGLQALLEQGAGLSVSKSTPGGDTYTTDKTNEILGSTLKTIHNLSFYLDLMSKLRISIEQHKFKAFVDNYRDTWDNSG